MKSSDLEKWIRSIDIKLDNHLVHVAEDISEIKNNLNWLTKFFWIIAGGVITSIIVMIGQLINR